MVYGRFFDPKLWFIWTWVKGPKLDSMIFENSWWRVRTGYIELWNLLVKVILHIPCPYMHAGSRFQVGQTFWDFSSIMKLSQMLSLQKWSELPQIFIHYGTFPNAFLTEMKWTSSNFHPLWNFSWCFFLGQVGDVYPWIFIHYASPPQTPPHSISVAKFLDAFLLWALNLFCNFPELLLQSQIVEFVKIFAPILVQFKGAKKHNNIFFEIILKFQKHKKLLF